MTSDRESAVIAAIKQALNETIPFDSLDEDAKAAWAAVKTVLFIPRYERQHHDLGCKHEILRFSSGDYYLMCPACSRSWVLHGEGDTADSLLMTKTNLSGQVRVAIDDD